MAKGSYLKKYLEKEGEQKRISSPRIQISEEKKLHFLEGQVLLIDKPLHWTSFDVIKKIRGTIGIKKVGHAGTLDPLATGLLIVCTGKATKEINELMGLKKTYTGSFTLGATTPTYDLESTPENFKDIFVSDEQILSATEVFKGEIMQQPPFYSAIKKNGTALYELARRGDTIDPEKRPVTIYEFEITGINLHIISFRVTCSTGTYIRSLAHDFGQHLGCGAYLSELRRTAIGEYKVEEAKTVEGWISGLVD